MACFCLCGVEKGGYCVGLVEAADCKRGSVVGRTVFGLKNFEKWQKNVGGIGTRFCSGRSFLCSRARGGQDTSFTELPSFTSHFFLKVRTEKSISDATTKRGSVGHDCVMRNGGYGGGRVGLPRTVLDFVYLNNLYAPLSANTKGQRGVRVGVSQTKPLWHADEHS